MTTLIIQPTSPARHARGGSHIDTHMHRHKKHASRQADYRGGRLAQPQYEHTLQFMPGGHS